MLQPAEATLCERSVELMLSDPASSEAVELNKSVETGHSTVRGV